VANGTTDHSTRPGTCTGPFWAPQEVEPGLEREAQFHIRVNFLTLTLKNSGQRDLPSTACLNTQLRETNRQREKYEEWERGTERARTNAVKI
jgi:hypothetical protein